MSAVVAAVGRALGEQTLAWVVQATAGSRMVGPDGDAVHVDGGCGLGHALLRTAPTDAQQPITLDGRTWITADARLDDRTGLLARLRAGGTRIAGDTCDAALILHAYNQHPDAFLDLLAGDFAFALWDPARELLTCARDQVGTTPLHYSRPTGGLLVATSIEALLLHPEVSHRLNEGAIADFLVDGLPADFGSTAFVDVHRVPPGHVLRWSPEGVTLRRYWRLPRLPLLRLRDRRDYVEQFAGLLDAAVADRVTGDRVAVHVSGGLDSTSIAASARRSLDLRGAPTGAVRGVTATLGGSSGDQEGHFAGLVARWLDLPLDVIDGSTLPVLDPFAPPLVRTPEPAAYHRTALVYDLARLPAEHAKVALSGLAGDALLWSGPWYWSGWLMRGQLGRLGAAMLDQHRLFGSRLHPGLRPGLGRALVSISPAAHRRQPTPGWLDADFVERTRVAGRARKLLQRAADGDVRSLVGDTMWATQSTMGHACFTGLPLSFRYPFLDLRLVRFVLSLPPEPWLRDKRILRDAAVERLPPEVRMRPKAALVAVPQPGLSHAAAGRLADLVRQAPDLEQFVDRTAVLTAIDDLVGKPTQRLDFELSRPIGLAHWLLHRHPPSRQRSSHHR